MIFSFLIESIFFKFWTNYFIQIILGWFPLLFWHLFTTTVHSPIGKNPQDFGITITGPVFEGFAQNDLYHEDPLGADHTIYTNGLNGILNVYLNKVGFEKNLQEWFEFTVVATSHWGELIEGFLGDMVENKAV